MSHNTLVGQPLTADTIFTPWELVGQSRRDCEPHRARLWAALAYTSTITGGLSFLCPLAALVGLGLGYATCCLARRDLDCMAAGDMDQGGYAPTRKAWDNARAAVILSLLGPSLWLALAFLVGLMVLVVLVSARLQ